MSEKEHNDQMPAYSEAVKSGLYAKKSGLVGKYDNVRRYWEDEISRHFMYPHLQKLVDRCQSQMRRIRIMDLGCGSADGYELLTGIRDRDSDLQDVEVQLLTPNVLGAYKGVDLNNDILKQARTLYGNNPKTVFRQADFTKGLPLSENEKPFDLYFSSFGTSSHHNDDRTLVRMLADIAKHTKDYSVVICDWLGRYSYEWQTLWTNDLKKHRSMDYVVSYIYDAEEREQRRSELQHLNLRLISRQEVDSIVKQASAKAGVEIHPLEFFDRSVFVGRHMDTAEYNPHAQGIRNAVNSLHEPNLRTDLTSLIINYVPKKGFDFVNDYFERLQVCWNTLIQFVSKLLINYDEQEAQFHAEVPSIPATYPKPLRETMERMRRVVEGVGWLTTGLPRENIIEPQLGYALRHLEINLQEGQGCAHGLVGVFEIDKK
jgi:SAM-dependent methyltransferase